MQTIKSLEKSGILTLEKQEVLRRTPLEEVDPAPSPLRARFHSSYRSPARRELWSTATRFPKWAAKGAITKRPCHRCWWPT